MIQVFGAAPALVRGWQILQQPCGAGRTALIDAHPLGMLTDEHKPQGELPHPVLRE
jgi:hypothetical protein